MNTNKKYKDRLFRFIFSNKKSLLVLYNAVNGSDYINEDDLEINTLEDIIYMSMKNDLSFVIDDRLNVYEHQSTYSPNMPLRELLYTADLYRKILGEVNIYGSRLIKIPNPQYIVFFNGENAKCSEAMPSTCIRSGNTVKPWILKKLLKEPLKNVLKKIIP